MRLLLNTNNNRILPWTPALAKKATMVECDKHGNFIDGAVTVQDSELHQALRDKAKECAQLNKTIGILQRQIEQWEAEYGPWESRLPAKTLSSDDAKSLAEAEAEKEIEQEEKEIEAEAQEELDKVLDEAKQSPWENFTAMELKGILRDRDVNVKGNLGKKALVKLADDNLDFEAYQTGLESDRIEDAPMPEDA